MDKNMIINVVYKNRILILCCAMLIFGCFFGITVLKILPENICGNLYGFLSRETTGFKSFFLDNFCFPAAILTAVFLAGFSVIGSFSVLFALFINGAFFSFINGLNYMFSGGEFFINCVISYFTMTLFFGFMLIVFAESAFYYSILLKNCIKNEKTEKTHYNAKNLTVKYISFTVILACFSAFSAYISIILQSVL